MPFCYDHYTLSEGGYKRRRLSDDTAMARSIYEETEEVRNSPNEQELLPAAEAESHRHSPSRSPEVETSDRDELIQRIKRGERPTWVPKPGLEALIAETAEANPLCDTRAQLSAYTPVIADRSSGMVGELSTQERQADADPAEPSRSAFHAGDFHEPRGGDSSNFYPHARSSPISGFSTSPPWHSDATPPSLGRARTDFGSRQSPTQTIRRSRAPSLGSSLSSSFVLRVPTSPLVHAVNNAALDFAQHNEVSPLAFNSENGINRRRTLPPEAFQSLDSHTADRRSFNFSRPLPTPQIRREASLPHQTHQVRRSLNSFTYQPALNPQTPTIPRSRRPSFASDTSPIQHAAMVGSFEESILRGRMSTAPSKPLDFVAQIGVLGRGNCKPSLKCPAHVSVPFPAVFYSYPSTSAGRSPVDDSPSPYVGTIDLEHHLEPVEHSNHRKRRRDGQDADEHMADLTAPENTAIGRALARDAQRSERQTSSLRAPPGGCYRVPQQGQLQIVIKNPNKTAVKLYLVPYDLDGMESGTKTFVRQRSFTAGPILEKPLSGSPEGTKPMDPLKDKRILRYLIHLKFCCPAKGRFYLYDNIRVVFANRVPDGKEKLLNEVQLPEPKFSIYKPGRDVSMGSAGAKLAAEKAMRRRSSGVGVAAHLYAEFDGLNPTRTQIAEEMPPLPTTAIPFHLATKGKPGFLRSESDQGIIYDPPSTGPTFSFLRKPGAETDAEDTENAPSEGSISAPNGFDASSLIRRSPIPSSHEGSILNGRNYSPVPPELGEGLLSRKFREHKEGAGLEDSR